MFLQILRYALRTLLSSPGFTAVAVLCLSLGIGVNGAIFSVVDGVLIQPYPYPEADRIVVLNGTNPRQNINRAGVSYADYKDWREQATTFAALAAFEGRSLTIADGASDPERFAGAPFPGPCSTCSARPPRSAAISVPTTIAPAPSRSCCCRTTFFSGATAATDRSSDVRLPSTPAPTP